LPVNDIYDALLPGFLLLKRAGLDTGHHPDSFGAHPRRGEERVTPQAQNSLQCKVKATVRECPLGAKFKIASGATATLRCHLITSSLTSAFLRYDHQSDFEPTLSSQQCPIPYALCARLMRKLMFDLWQPYGDPYGPPGGFGGDV
jgi:hypothetical protein